MEASEQQATGQPVPPEGEKSEVSGPPPGQAPQSQQEGQVEVPEHDEEGQPQVQGAPKSPLEEAEDERSPATEQAPVASEAAGASIGFEQEPRVAEGGAQHVDTPVGTSMPPPQAQSGMPLPEDRAAAAAAEEEK
jgi:hypothetical protein